MAVRTPPAACRQGQVVETVKRDWRLAKLLMSLRGKNTAGLINGVAKVLADEGIQLGDSTRLLKPLLAAEGVLHVSDDVLLLAKAAIGAVDPLPQLVPATHVHGFVLADACRYYEFRVVSLDDREERTTIDAEVVHAARLRDFFGFNRAKHAVVEGAILATRKHLLPAAEIAAEYRRLAVLVEKTGGTQEREAFQLLHDYVKPAGEAAV